MGKIKVFLSNIQQKVCLIRNKIIDKDDFNWQRYHKNYFNQLHGMEKNHTLKLSKENFKIFKKGFVLNKLALPLHENHEILYRVIYDLHPKSIFEVGCGGGDHLMNLNTLMDAQKIKFSGSDLLSEQIKILYNRNPELKKLCKIFVHNIIFSPISQILGEKVDLIYTQAVIMHIQKSKNHMRALMNLFHSSNKYVVLMENWERHNFYEDLKKISKYRNFPWNKFFMYKVDSGKQIIVVLSNCPIKSKSLKYVKIKNNKDLLKYF